MKTRGMFALLIAVCSLLLGSSAHASWTIVCEDDGSAGSGSRHPDGNNKHISGNGGSASDIADIRSGEDKSFSVEAKVNIKVFAV